MKQLMRRRYEKTHDKAGDDGFTLIELLVVIVILAILAAIVVFSVAGVQDRGKKSACDTTRKTLITASEAFRANDPNGNPSPDLQGLAPYAKDIPASGNDVVTDAGTLTYVADGTIQGTCT